MVYVKEKVLTIVGENLSFFRSSPADENPYVLFSWNKIRKQVNDMSGNNFEVLVYVRQLFFHVTVL